MNAMLDGLPVTATGAAAARPRRLWRVRKIRPHDAQLLGAFFAALSPESRRRRFHFGLGEVPQAWLERFTRPDAQGELGLVAVAMQVGREVCIGEVRYAPAEGAPAVREFALVIADAWQGTGLGRGLLERLTRHAARHGVTSLHGDVQRDNLPMLGLARALGHRTIEHPSDATLRRVVIDASSARHAKSTQVSDETIAGPRRNDGATWAREHWLLSLQ